MVKEHTSVQLRLKKLIQSGRINFTSIDTSINSCGICSGVVSKITYNRQIAVIINDLSTLISSKPSIKLKTSEIESTRIESMSSRIINRIKDNNSRLVLIENPEKSIVYGSKKHGISYILKRANSVCIVKCINYFICGFIKAKDDGILIIKVKPSEWQDKSEIKKYKDSKDWSTSKVNELLNMNKHLSKNICVLNRSNPLKITEHSSDALLMMYKLLEKTFD